MPRERTAGPWIADNCGYIYREDPNRPGEIEWDDERIGEIYGVGDRNLVVKAPQLLVALEEMVDIVEALRRAMLTTGGYKGKEYPQSVPEEKARQLIAQAKGEK